MSGSGQGLTQAEEALVRSAGAQLRAGDAAGAVAKLLALTEDCVCEGACKLCVPEAAVCALLPPELLLAIRP